MARFKREAQILASLNHPNIAAICGLEESVGALALAIEFVDGEGLAVRLEVGQPAAVGDQKGRRASSEPGSGLRISKSTTPRRVATSKGCA